MLVGVRRATLKDVAARAGVSRPTVYSRFPDFASVLGALMTREFVGLIDRAVEATEGAGDERERIVRAAVQVVELLGEHPLFERILDVDPELLLPYVTVRRGQFQQAIEDRLVTRLRAGIAEGSVRLADPVRLARALEVASRGFALSARTTSAAERAEALEDLARMFDGLLAP